MSYILINGFFISNPAFIDTSATTPSLYLDLSNLFRYGTGGNVGEYVPSFIKIEGQLTVA